MTGKKLELVGISEIAELATSPKRKVSRQQVNNWINRSDDMPAPYQRVRAGPLWDKEEIVRWLVKIGFTHLNK